MTDEEIAEIVDMDMECNKNADDRDRELAELSEITYYERQAHLGELTEEGEEKLRRLRGVIYTFRFNGEQILVNHCLISKIVMGVFIMCCAASICYIAAFVKPI